MSQGELPRGPAGAQALLPRVAGQGDECPACRRNRDAGKRYCSECGRPLASCPRSEQLEKEPEPVVAEPAEVSSPPCAADSLPLVPRDDHRDTANERPESKRNPTCACGAGLPADACYCPKCGVRVGEVRTRRRLVRRTKDGAGVAFDLPDDMILIGKDPACGVTVDDDEYVSRRHARISNSDGLLFLEDLGSANGTFLRIRRPIVLEIGDEIVAGTTVFRLEDGR